MEGQELKSLVLKSLDEATGAQVTGPQFDPPGLPPSLQPSLQGPPSLPPHLHFCLPLFVSEQASTGAQVTGWSDRSSSHRCSSHWMERLEH
eukprot:2664035-Rhodomonas_salina.1